MLDGTADIHAVMEKLDFSIGKRQDLCFFGNLFNDFKRSSLSVFFEVKAVHFNRLPLPIPEAFQQSMGTLKQSEPTV